MKEFFNKNKIPISIIIAGIIIAGSILVSSRPTRIRQQIPEERKQITQQLETKEQTQQTAIHINYTEAPEHVGEYACVEGKVDHIYTSQKGTIFINFCSDYKTCAFGAVIFGSDAYKFPKTKQYEGKTVKITGLIRTYQGLAEIVINEPGQIELK